MERFKKENDIENKITIADKTPKHFKIASNIETMEGVLCTILSNAWEAYPIAEPDENREVWMDAEISNEDGKDVLNITVFDDGQGIDEEVKDNLFEPFITTKSSVGRGLGLTIARHKIKSLQGDISIKKHDNGWTQVIVKHPIQ